MEKITEDFFEQSGSKIINKEAIKSIAEYLNYIDYLNKKWRNHELWYRGVLNKDYKLVPSIYRDEIWKYNITFAYNLFNEFIRPARSFNKDYVNFNKWEWYQLQQHYGLPTRLLDWTQGSLIALYFSVRKLEHSISPSVWVINPFKLNYISIGINKVLYTDKLIQDKDDSIIEKFIYDDKDLQEYPVAILPTYLDNRLSSQKSTFTVHGLSRDGIEQFLFKNNKNNVVQLLLDPSQSKIIKDQLSEAGISEYTLFPDLEGLSRELKYNYRMK
ncbi:MAG: FRG domain-containing protein [Bacteroidetes bacterium]|nr:FRG domain-containing protein [Bacteroidota bacterium]